MSDPLIGVHAWRQADTAAMARNFYRNGFHLLYPQIDWGGNGPGYVECEFPLFPYLVALLYQLFGLHEMWGRVLAAVCSVICCYYLYRLVELQIDRATALWSAAFYALLPLNIYFDRAFMPEAAMSMTSVAAIYYFARWVRTDRWRDWLFSLLFVSLACTIKLPCLYLGIPLLCLAEQKFGKRTPLQSLVWLYFGLGLLAVFAWYYHAHQILHQYGLTFQIWGYSTDKWGNWRLTLSSAYWLLLFKRSTLLIFATWGMPIFLAGVLLKRKTPGELVFDGWLATILLYFVVVGRGNAIHEYYQLPLVLPACVFMGKVYGRYFRIEAGKPPLAATGLTVLLTMMLWSGFTIYNVYYMPRENPASSPLYAMGMAAQRTTPAGSLVVAIDDNDPTLLYQMDRKGWHASAGDMGAIFLDDRAREGALYVAGLKSAFHGNGVGVLSRLLAQRPVVTQTKDYFIVRLIRHATTAGANAGHREP